MRASVLAIVTTAVIWTPGAAQTVPAGSPSLLAGNSEYDGLRIDGIVFAPSRQPLEPETISKILPLKRGEPFHTADARDAIQRLYATGRYDDIAIDGTPRNGGVLVRITTRNSWFTGRVEIEGDIPEPPNAGQLVTASRLDLGQPFDPAKIKLAEENMRRLLIANGFYDSRVESESQYDDLTQQVNLTFTITARHRARFSDPAIKSDNQVLTDQQIVRASHWHWMFIPLWHQVTQQRVNNGVEKIRMKYQSANRLLATVSLDSVDHDETRTQPRRTSPLRPDRSWT